MGEFNPHAPDLLGLEHQPRTAPTVKLDSALSALAMRFRAPGAITIDRLHPYIAEVAGNPGLAVEIVDTLLPEVTFTDFYPGTDTGASVTGWEDQGNSTANFGEIDDQFDTTDYHRNAAGLSRQSTLINAHRGDAAGALAGKRILRVEIGAVYHLRKHASGNDSSVPLRGILVIDGTTYRGPRRNPQGATTFESNAKLAAWARNPSTGLPWTAAEVDDIIDAADADMFGIEVGGKLAAEGFRHHGRWLRVWHCPENRKGYFYVPGRPQAGWTERTLTATAALTADTSYWYVIYPLLGATGDFLRVPAPRDPSAVIDDDAAGSGEHRTAYSLDLFSVGGCAVAADEIDGGLLPVLFDSDTDGSSIRTPSQPYAEVDPIIIDRTKPAGTNPGQQITASAGDDYVAVDLTVGWSKPQVRPNRPLVIEVRAGSVGGTLVATATLAAKDTTRGPARYLVKLDTGFTSTATQYHLVVTSDANPASGWRIYRLDTRSDDLGTGTTASEVQGATQGGTTDSWFVDGSASDRYDLDIALVAAPDGPANLAATVQEAT